MVSPIPSCALGAARWRGLGSVGVARLDREARPLERVECVENPVLSEISDSIYVSEICVHVENTRYSTAARGTAVYTRSNLSGFCTQVTHCLAVEPSPRTVTPRLTTHVSV